MNGSNPTLKRREFVTRAAMLLFSGAILGACDDELELGDCIEEPDMDEPACPELDALEPPEAEPAAPVAEPETFPAGEDDDLLFLRSLE